KDTTSSCAVAVAGVEPPADLPGRERVGAGVLELVLGEVALVPGADSHVVRLVHLHAHHLPHQRPQPRAAEVGPPERVGGEGAQVHGARHLQPVPDPQPGGVVADPDADEGEPGIGEEAGQRVGHVVGVEDLEDEAAAVDAELQHGDGARHGGGGAPLHVEADDERVAAAAVDAVRLAQPRLHLAAGLGERCVEEVLVER
ncbi:Os04g0225067, partial [Oryza sativa Japonica Group]